jgi:hypothetical protein
MNDSLLVFPHRNRRRVGYGLIFVDEVDYRRRFAGSGRTIKHQIRKILAREDVLEKHSIHRVQHNIVESAWTVFLNPRYVVLHGKGGG